MKGTLFQKPLEFNLHVEGESWKQGDPVRGSLLVKNHGTESVALSEIRVHLAEGGLKKVRLKTPGAFEVLSSISGPEVGLLEPGKEATIPWSFLTDRNSSITDSFNSPFLVYGRGEALETLGQLQLFFHPYEIIQEFIKIIGTRFRFVVKSQRGVKRGVDIKLVPPAGSKAFSSLEHLVLSFRFEGETLELRYSFQVKKLEASAAAVDVKKQKSELEQSFTPEQYRVPSGRVNDELLESAIGEALKAI
jgi:hypothetical protein